jgi:hypothetical protein
MSFREKRAWIVLAATLAVYLTYFVLFGRAWAAGEGSRFGFFLPVAATVIALVVIEAVSLIAVTAAAPFEAQAPYDERDRLIDTGAGRAAFYVLQAGVFAALVGVMFGLAPALIANALLAVMVLGDAAKALWQVIGYRRSAA